MHLPNIAMIFLFLIASPAGAVSISQFKSHFLPKFGTSRDTDIPISLPNQTIGHYFDSLSIKDQNTLSGRSIHRTSAFTEVTWTDGTINFNISMSRCIAMSDKAGLYTAKKGNLPNATVQDIMDDLQVREGSEAANRVEYSSRVQENAELAIIAANGLLKAAIVDYTPITTSNNIIHTELRHLLTMMEMSVIIIRASLMTEILVSSFASVMGGVFGEVDTIGATISAIILYSVQLVIGIHNMVVNQYIDYMSAAIFNIFLAWVRDSIRAFSDQFLPAGTPKFLPTVAYDKIMYGKGTNRTATGSFTDGSTWPLAQDIVKMAVGALGNVNQPKGRFKAAADFKPPPTCPAH